MHYTGVVVRDVPVFDDGGGVFLEVEEDVWRNVVPDDGDVIITIWSCLFVVESYSVAQFMHDDSRLENRMEIIDE